MARGALIQYRRGSTAQWSAANPVLASGEVGYDTTANEVRIGNGVLPWSSLPPIGGSVPEEQIASAVETYLEAHPTPTLDDVDIALLVLDEDTETHAAVRSLVPEGPAGDSAYQVAVSNGFVGDQAAWLASLHGEPGATTIAGVDGLRKELDDRALTADVVGFVDSVGTAITGLSAEVGTKATQDSVNALSSAQVVLAGNLDAVNNKASDALATAAAAAQHADLASSPVIVRHGSNAALARPSTARPVFWVGSVHPNNAIEVDLILTSSSAPVFVGALDAFAAPFRAHSLRRTLSAYTGPLIKVRRSSDNTTLEVGATSTGDLDTAALLSFVGSSDGFVETFYDQGPTGRHLSQATAANQPRIVAGGVLDSVNGKPALVFDGVSDLLVNPTAGLFAAAAATVAAVMKSNSNAVANATVFAESRTANNNGFWRAIRGSSANWNVQATDDAGTALWASTAAGSNLFDLAHHQAVYIEAGGQINTWKDGAPVHAAIAAARAGATTPVQTTLGAHSGSSATSFYNGAVQELVAWSSAQAASRGAIEDAQSTYWGTP